MARGQQRKAEKAKRHASSISPRSSSPATGVRYATEVRPLAYTRTQAAAALGVSRTTFDRRVLPLLETIEVPWGPRLVPVDELERIAREWRQPARGRAQTAPVGRPRVVSDELVLRIRSEHADGKSLRQIARDLNASHTPTAHGGRQWWPSTVRAALTRTSSTRPSG
ncbi:MAG: recombinase family protein [Gaiellaceae bacterium]